MLRTTRQELDNGLTVLLTHYPQSSISAVETLVDFGPIDENRSNTGAAHFIEHMAFKGTEKRTTSDISRCIDDVGGNINAATMKDMTSYYIELPQKHLNRAIDLLSDILLNSQFPEKEMAQEKKVIQEEIKMIGDTPQRAIWDNIFSLAYKGSQIGRSISGTIEDIDGFTRDELADIHSRYYTPGRMVLSIVADLEKTSQEEIVDLAKEKFTSAKKAEPLRREKPEDLNAGMQTSEEKKDINQAHQILAFKFPSIDHDDWMIGKAVQKYLTGGMSSVLFTEIREKRGLAYAVYSDYLSSKTFGLYSVYTATTKENRDIVEKIMVEEFKKLSDQRISEEDLSRLKGYMEGEFLTKMDNKLTLAGTLGQYEIYDTYESAGKYIGDVHSITPEKIQEFARKYLDTENYFRTLIQPKSQG